MSNKVLKNTSWMITAGIAESLIGFVISIFTVRYLGPSNYGLINYAASLVSILAPFTNLGFNAVMVKEIINNPKKDGEITGTIMGFSFVSSFLCYLGMIGFCYLSNPGDKETLIVCALYGTSILLNFLRLLDYWVQAKQLIKYSSISAVIVYTCVSIYRLYLLSTGKSVYWFAMANSLDTVILSIFLIIIYRKFSNNILTFNFSIGLNLLKVSKYYLLLTLMENIFANMDRIMIKKMIGNEANGYYGAALTTALLSYFVLNSICSSYKPQILEYKNSGDEDAYRQSIINLYSIVIYMFFIQAVVFAIFSKLIIKVLYGEAYIIAASILSVLAFSKLFDYIGVCRGVWILAEDKHKELTIINTVAIFLNALLNYILIKKFGVIGAAYATLLTSVFNNLLSNIFITSIKENLNLIVKSLNPKIFITNLKYLYNIVLKRS